MSLGLSKQSWQHEMCAGPVIMAQGLLCQSGLLQMIACSRHGTCKEVQPARLLREAFFRC